MPHRWMSLGLSAVSLIVGACLVVGPRLDASTRFDKERADFARTDPRRAIGPQATRDPVWQLGRRLFFETRLSGPTTLSCASCHQPDLSWTDRQPRAVGHNGQRLAFRTPTLLNAGQLERYGWSGRFKDVEAVAFFAMNSPANMNVSPSEVLARLRSEPSYVAQFQGAFKDDVITKGEVGAALSRYVRSIVSDEAPFDRWIAGDAGAISVDAARGFDLFKGKARCAECHSGWALTDGSFHDIGLAGSDLGRGKLFPSSAKLQHAFKTPTLRNVAVRAPYMHDGSMASLEAVVDHYAKGGIDRPSRAEAVRPIDLTPQDKKDVVEFLKTLTSGTTFVSTDEPTTD